MAIFRWSVLVLLISIVRSIGFDDPGVFPVYAQTLQESEPDMAPLEVEGYTSFSAQDAIRQASANLAQLPPVAEWQPNLSKETGYRLWDCIHLALEQNRPLRNARDNLRIAQITLRERQEEFGNIYQLGAGAHYDENLAHTNYDRYSFSFGGTEGGASGLSDGTILSRRFPYGGTLSLGGRTTYQSTEIPRYAYLLDGNGNPVVDANGDPVLMSRMADIRWFSEANLVITQPLLEGAGEVAMTGLRVQELEQAITNLNLERSIQAVISEVVQDFLGVQQAISLALVQQDSYQRALTVFQLTQEKAPFTPADVAPIELLRGEQQVTSTQQQLIDAKNDVETNLIQLRLSMGIEPNATVILASTDVPVVPQPAFSVDEAVAEALRIRPDLRALQLTIRQQELYLEAARNALLPNLDFSARMGLSDEADDLYESYSMFDYQNVGADLRLNLPLNLPSDKANFQRNQILVRQARTRYEQLEREIANEVDRAYRAQQTLIERVAVLRRNEELARKTFETMAGLAEYGQIDPFDLVQTQNDLTSASATRVRAEIQFVNAIAILDYAMGRPISEVMARYSPAEGPPSK